MVNNNNHPPTPFEKAYHRASGYQLATPYGTVSITEDGRRITFQLYEDVRESIHHKALFGYYQQLIDSGITKINVDHLDLPNLDRSLNLRRGKAKLDLCYIKHGRLLEVELKTHREIGLDVTSIQLKELSKHCQNFIVVVPRRDQEEMDTVLKLIGLDRAVTVDTFEMLDIED